jgi:hypothetical protein
MGVGGCSGGRGCRRNLLSTCLRARLSLRRFEAVDANRRSLVARLLQSRGDAEEEHVFVASRVTGEASDRRRVGIVCAAGCRE